ncbi:MAG: hypothetical protein ABSD03_11040 [Vulcanimicrobiaceae bacterium]
MHVLDGKTIREIKAETGAALETIVADIRFEELRRADELAERREGEKARAIAYYENIGRRALQRAEIADDILEQIRNGAECEKKVNDRSFEAAIKARERIDKLLGLDAPTKGDAAIEKLVEALTEIPAGQPLFPSDLPQNKTSSTTDEAATTAAPE